jgi:hypothetical protein
MYCSMSTKNLAKMKAEIKTLAQFKACAKCDPTGKPWEVVAEAYGCRADSAYKLYRDLLIREG